MATADRRRRLRREVQSSGSGADSPSSAASKVGSSRVTSRCQPLSCWRRPSRPRRGAAEAIVFPTPTVQPGQVFLPMHFATVNQLTFPSFDPHSRQPSYKACAVQLEKAP